MYPQTDKRAAIKEIQKYLFTLSDERYPEIPRIPIDGIFDKETESAVIKYQELKSFTTTGKVDYETFTALYDDYVTFENELNTPDYIFGDSALPLKENDQNEDVRALHIMINELRKTYREIPSVGNGAYFTRRTADAIEELRAIFGMDRSRQLDKALYKRMLTEIDSRKRLEEMHE